MQVDFYQLSRDPVDRVVPLLAGKVLDSGERLLVVTRDAEQRQTLSRALWDAEAFLAHGMADLPHAERQPILLSDSCAALNGARMALIADGRWREEAAEFARVFLLFDEAGTVAARELWQVMAARAGVKRRIFKQTPRGSWREGA